MSPATLTRPPIGDTIRLGEGAQAQRLTVRAFGLTDPGRVRESNEDQFLIASLSKALQVRQTSLPQPEVHYSHEQGHIFVVADGMGGHAAGEKASALAVDTLEHFILDTLKWFFHLKGREGDEALAEFQKGLLAADARVFSEASRNPQWRGMGTTLTLAYCLDRDLFVVHVGDSRCYLLHGDQLYRITRDHTIVQEMVSRGYLSPEEAAQHQFRHMITQAIGGDTPGVNADVHKVHLAAGDVLLLCTDGLSEMVPEADIARTLAATPDPQEACRRLVEQANAQGGKDNVTAVVARFDEAA